MNQVYVTLQSVFPISKAILLLGLETFEYEGLTENRIQYKRKNERNLESMGENTERYQSTHFPHGSHLIYDNTIPAG